MNVSVLTATLSSASAVTSTWAPGSTCAGARSVTLGGARSTAGPMVAVVDTVCDRPRGSVTVRVMEYAPAAANVWMGAGPDPVVVSPKLQA